MTEWLPLPLGSSLSSTPSSPVHAPVMGKPELLPFNQLAWEDFERLQWRVMRDVEGLRHAQLYGNRGQAQFGLDIVALHPDGIGVALQSKKYETFGPADITAAVDKFLERERPFPVHRLIIGVATTVRTTKAIDELAKQRRALRPTTLDLWDAQELSYLLRDRPDIVIEFFGLPTAEAFCAPFKVDVTAVPAADSVAVREAMARTPEVTTGAQQLFAEAAAASDPSQALSLIEAGQTKLREAGFGPHAAQHDADRIRLLASLGRADEAARYVLDGFWTALDQGLSITAQAAQSQMNGLSRVAAENEQIKLYQRVTAVAIDLHHDPLAFAPSIDSLLIGDSLDQVRLVLLAGEMALANDDQEWLDQAVPVFTQLLSSPTLDQVLHTRLRLLLAESTSDWSGLLSDARKLKLGYSLFGLVTARYARYCALHQKFEEADLAWDEASGAASLSGQWGEASTWIYSRRAFRSHWKPFTSNELLPLQRAIREMGTSSPLVPAAEGAYEDALTALSEQRLRSAAISAQRALRDAVTASDWVGEDRARRVLASILIESDEPALAARHLARAGASKAIEALGRSLPLKFVVVLDDMDAPNYWTVGTTYRLLAAQADLVPDDEIGTVSEHLVDELSAAEAGSRPDLRAFATSRYNNAVKALAGVADRLTEAQADIVLRHFEKQPHVEKNHYRYHDEDEAVVVAQIAIAHAPLAGRAITHLVPLLGRSQGARNSRTLDAIDKNQTLAHDALTDLAKAGNHWAREMLAFDGSTEPDPKVAAEALTRLTTPLEHREGVYSEGTNAIGDSLLVRHLPSASIHAAMDELLTRADDPHVGSSDRGAYLIAAANLAPHTDQSKRDEYFGIAVRLVTSPSGSIHDKLDEQYTHKLGAIRTNGERRESRGQALHLAAMLAADAAQCEGVRRLAYSLLGENSDYWPTRALERLGDTVNDDLAFLASQGWAIRRLAANMWVTHPEPEHLGNKLAGDPDVRVRRALAHALSQNPAMAYPTVYQQLLTDPAHSVRTALRAPAQ